MFSINFPREFSIVTFTEYLPESNRFLDILISCIPAARLSWSITEKSLLPPVSNNSILTDDFSSRRIGKTVSFLKVLR